LVKVAQLDPETVDLHFSLGNLFRRRGETERAIRVHQHLANRDDIKPRDRDHAAYELGRDFLRAGLLDRAEASLNQVGQGKYAIPAKESLLEMYQVEKDWKKAIIAATELQGLQDKSHQLEIAQFYCEIAQEALRRKDMAEAETSINHALQAIPNQARALILQGDYFLAMERPLQAIEVWGVVAKESPAFMHLVAVRWMAAHSAVSQADTGFTLSALSKLAETRLVLAEATGPESRVADLKSTLGLLKQRTTALARYTCGNCGFRARRFYWQCPGCNHWEAYSPRRSEGAVPSGPSM